MSKKGIDVSHHQGVIDWNKVKKSDVDFIMIRACYGWDNDKQIDKQLNYNVQACEMLSIPYGLFHYSYAMSKDDAVKEARFFLKVINGFKPTYPVAFDFEEPSQLKLPAGNQIDIIKSFMSEIENAGYYGVLYMSASPMENLYRLFPGTMKKYDCWVAHVGVSKPAFSGNYGMWQYSWNGKVNGINGDVDLDYSYRDYESIIKSMNVVNQIIPSNPSNNQNPEQNIENIFEEFSNEVKSLLEKYKKVIK